MKSPRGIGSPPSRSGACTEVDDDERESSKVVKNPFSRFSARQLQLHAFSTAVITVFKGAEAR